MYLIFSLGLCLSSSIAWYALGMSAWDSFFGVQYQWMMVFALPLLWTYNGKKANTLGNIYFTSFTRCIFGFYMPSAACCPNKAKMGRIPFLVESAPFLCR